MARIRIIDRGKPGVSPTNKKDTLLQPVGFGYIFMPVDVDRDLFVQTCYRTGRVTIIDDAGGGVIKDCYITVEALQNVKFPRECGKMGQPVMWVAQGFQNQPVVIGTFPLVDKVEDRMDEAFKVHREWDGNVLDIQGSARDGVLFINIEGSPAFMKLSANGGDDSVLELNSSGTVKVTGCQKLQATAYEEMNVELLDVEADNRTGITVNKDGIAAEANYGEENNKNAVKSSINGEGINVEAVYDEKSYSVKIDSEASITKFQNSTVELKEDSLSIEQGAAKIAMENGKVSWVNNNTGLNDLLKKLHDIIQNLTVSTASGPSGTPLPPTVLALEELDTLLTNFFNE